MFIKHATKKEKKIWKKIKKMNEKNMDINEIEEITGLTKEEIKRL